MERLHTPVCRELIFMERLHTPVCGELIFMERLHTPVYRELIFIMAHVPTRSSIAILSCNNSNS